jgi:diadenosine tetraphosphate (Ap4A) HIT family hydrolase
VIESSWKLRTPLRSPMATPVAPDPALVVPRRHVASIFDLATEEQTAVWDLVGHIRGALVQALHPDDSNIGLNDAPPPGRP